MPAQKYIETVGRRKRAIARVRLYTDNKKEQMVVNEKDLQTYFPTKALASKSIAPFAICEDEKPIFTARVSGGGTSAQSEAIRHGIARALIIKKAEYRDALKKAGFLKRDPRKKERKKFGLKKARRAPQWSKR